MNLSRALGTVATWIALALLFNTGILFFQGQQKALEFLTGYVIELSLSIDNLFVFYLIFLHFKVTPHQQSKILFWGVLGAQLMRAIFILAGVALLKNFGWMVYVLGTILVFSGFRLFFQGEKSFDFKKFIPQGISSLLIVLLVIEIADLVFALDSIPAVFAVTKDPFIVYSSNIFAILGLRSMYFVLSPMMGSFKYLHYALGTMLLFVGGKMFLDPIWPIPTAWALSFIIFILAIFIFVSYFKQEARS